MHETLVLNRTCSKCNFERKEKKKVEIEENWEKFI
jgi:hypothetical protein